MDRSSETADLHQLTQLAARFRDAVEKCDRSSLPISFERFPRGSCGDVTLLLGTFLKEQQDKTFTYVLGELGEGFTTQSHAWLEADGVIVDITADQFGKVTQPVIVTRNSAWHRQFRQKRMQNADFRIYDPHTVFRLEAVYAMILEKMDR